MKSFAGIRALALLAFISLTQTGWSQCKEFAWPEDKAKAEEQMAIYDDARKQKNYRAAVPGIQWFLTNAPKWNTKLYIDAAEVYAGLATAEKDPAKKQVLVDSLMWIYDQRIAICNDEVNVLNRKASHAATFNGQNKDKTAEVLKLFDRVFEISGNNVTESNLDAYMKIVYANFRHLKNLSDDDIFNRYDKLEDVIDAKINALNVKIKAAEGKPAEVEKLTAEANRLKVIKGGADDTLVKMVNVDCNFVKTKLEPKFRQTPNDPALAKKIFGFMLVGKCTDDPLWTETGEVMLKNSEVKDYGIAKNLGVKYLSRDEDQKALAKFQEALTVASTATEKSETMIYIGTVQAKMGNKPAARETFRNAAATDPSNKEAWEKIGDLYANSMSECKKLESQAQDRLIFIAAYEMYAKAGASSKMANVKEQFPSKEDIFLYNWKVGEVKSTGCWVGEAVALRTRD
jgi:tetratricopeptide (TPR) repeat protein